MRKYYVIDSIFDGWQPSFHLGNKGQFLRSIGLDPDVPLTDTSTDIITSGILRPVSYAKFSGSNVNSHPIAIFTNPKNTLTYAILRNGKLISYDSSLGSETTVGTVAGNQASGGGYYNNYIYILGTGASHDDASRYGPLDNSPSLTDGVWKGATLGTQTALVDTTYPTTRNSVQYPNHASFTHVDDKFYFLDYKQGQGKVHFIKTKRVTNEGDTNDTTIPSAYGALNLPFNFLPMSIGPYGQDVAILGSYTSNSSVRQGPSVMILWNPTISNFYRQIPIPDPLATAYKYANGQAYLWSGSNSGGVRLSRYVGGDSIQTVKYMEEGHPPAHYATADFGNRLVWGGFVTYPDNSAGLMAYGSKSDLFPRGLHHIATSSLTATASNGVITAVANAQQGSAFPKFLSGGTDGTNTNIDKQSTTYGTHYFRGPLFNIGRQFDVAWVATRFGQAIAANMTLVPKLFFDNESNPQAGTTINATNYANSERFCVQGPDNFSNNVTGKNNFYLELKWTGTALLSVLLPIVIAVDVSDNEYD